ncbi:GTP cyclohydrolase I type 2/NIF3 family protein [Pleurotus pulmonarius]
MSALLKAVCRSMERIAPLRLAEKWDNVGLLLESPIVHSGRNKVLLTIDLTPAVLEESLRERVSVIVAYHPPIFRPLQTFTLSNPLQASLLSVWGGVNDWLGEGVLGSASVRAGKIESLVADKIGPNGEKEGAEGRLVTLSEPIAMSDLESRIKQHLGLEKIQVGYGTDAGRHGVISTVAICAGSGGSMLVGKKADVYFTGEMAHHEILASVASGTNVVLCGHTNTERGYLPVLAARLNEEFQTQGTDSDLKGVDVVISQADKHPLLLV